MAEIENKSGKSKVNRFSRGKKLSTKVDLTPMVDLGFLLITFFIFTTSLASPVAMNLIVPDSKPTNQPVKISELKILTLVLSNDNKIYYYSGFFNGKWQEADFKSLREVIREKKQQVLKKFGKNALSVVIKPGVEANYQNLVDCLDEMVINDVSTYILDEPELKELISLKSIKL
ncbi:MAG TPA: biopolymer transporter ExbD [Segetibacter sp.]|jgi:biopolymer transport protein ExbD